MAAYGVNTLLGALGSLISLAIVLRVLGPAQWAVIAVGQSVAAVGATICGWGWAVTGTASVAVMTEQKAKAELHLANLGRMAVLVPVSVLTAFAAAALAPSRPLLAATTAASFSAVGVSSAWYFVGRGDATGLILRDTLPRQLAMLGGAGLVAIWGNAFLFPLATLLGISVAVLLAEQRCWQRDRLPARLQSVGARLRAQKGAAVAAVSSVAYLNAPLLIVSVAAPQTLAAYALAERIFKMANTATNPITQHLQSEIPKRAANSQHSLRRSSITLALLGLLSGLMLLVVYVPAASFISSGRITLSLAVMACFCGVMVATTISQVVGQSVLVVLGATRHLGISAALGAVFGLPLMIGAGLVSGGSGVAIALLVSEVLVTCYQLTVVWRRTR